MSEASTRARPLSVEDRQAMIIDAVIPLLIEHGKDVTSKQIAEAAGVAEGTIFRAFGDKETLIAAAVASFMEGRGRADLEPLIDVQLPLDEKLAAVIEGMQHRIRDVMRLAALSGRRGPGPGPNDAQRIAFNALISATFDNHRNELSIDPDDLGDYVRMFAIASSLPVSTKQFTTAELIHFIKHGIMKSKD